MKFKILGCQITISFLFLSFITFLSIFSKSNVITYGVISAIIHELGHICAMTAINRKPKEIKLGLFDINIIDNKQSYTSIIKEITMLLSGPLANFIFALISYIILNKFNKEYFTFIMYENLFLAILNLLPIESLDGGQILYILLLQKLDTIKSQQIIKLLSSLVLVPLSILGFLILLKSKYNFSLLFISLYLIIILLLKKDKFF